MAQKPTSAAFRKRVGAILYDARSECGMTSYELGAQVGVAHNMILDYEHGKKMPSLATMLRIMKFFNMDGCKFIQCL